MIRDLPLDVEGGLKEVLSSTDPFGGLEGEERRLAKERTFHARYAGKEDHSWRQLYEGNWTPPEEGEGRMTVSHPPPEY